MEVSFALNGLMAFVLVTVRVASFLMVAPPFNSTSIPSRMRGMIAFAVALPVFPRYVAQATMTGTHDLVVAIVWQMMAGLTLGFAVQMLFAAVQAAGNIVDMLSSFAMASMLDPLSNTQSAVFGRIYGLLATTLLFSSGGHLLLMRGLLLQFEVFPVSPMNLGRLAELLAGNMDRLFLAAVQIGAPILAVLFLTDLALGLVSRAVPSLNIFSLSFPVKTILVVSLAALAVAMMPRAIDTIVRGVLDQFPAVTGSTQGIPGGGGG